jgi:hypothetical protein
MGVEIENTIDLLLYAERSAPRGLFWSAFCTFTRRQKWGQKRLCAIAHISSPAAKGVKPAIAPRVHAP